MILTLLTAIKKEDKDYTFTLADFKNKTNIDKIWNILYISAKQGKLNIFNEEPK